MDAPLVPEILQLHGQFVQSLARSLLRDAHQAEDVTQEAWTRFVERGPREARSARNWLRTVTRNLAFNAQRRERTRRERQEHAARPEALPSAAEELAQGECLRRVIEAVLALDEPYRATILARYYQGRDLRNLAEETGTPLATLRSREQRALELLRARLDREVGGERACWALGLARLVGSAPETAAVTGAFASTGAVAAAWLAVGVAAAGLVWGAVRHRGEPAAVDPASARVARSEPVEPVSSPASSPPASGTRVAVAGSPAPARTSAATERGASAGASSALQAQQAELRGRFVLPGGAPAAGVSVQVSGWGSNAELVLQFGEPESWQDPVTTTDGDGRFTLRFDPPRAYQFGLDATLPGHAGASWRWSELRAGTTTDVGEVELPVGGIIEGRIVDRDGQELPGDWRVYVDSIGLGRNEGRDETGVSAPVAPGTGSFRLVDVFPGPNELRAHSRMVNWTRGQRITAIGGEAVTADIVYSGPDNSRRVTVITSSTPFHVMSTQREHVLRLMGPGLAPRVAQKIEGSASSYSFEDLPPGFYTIELDDLRFLPWRMDGVAPGTALSARLEGSSALALDVRGPDGAPLERYEVRVAFRNVNFFPREFRVREAGAPLPGGIVRGMFAGDYTVTVLAEGLGSRPVEVDSLVAGETRAVSIRFGDEGALTLAGQVVHPDGIPVADADIVLLRPAEIADSPSSRVLRKNSFTSDPENWRQELHATTTDADGRFRFDLARPGRYALQAVLGPMLSTASAALDVASGVSLADVELVLPRGGRAQGRLLGPEDRLEGLRIWGCPANEGRALGVGDPGRSMAVEVGGDGWYEIGPFDAGELRVFLLLPERAGEFVQQTESHVSGGVELGAVEVVEGQATRADFTLGERLPGEVTLIVLVNGSPASGVEVTLRPLETQDPTRLRAVTLANGETAPVVAFPGLYRALVRDPQAGWSDSCTEQVLVAASANVRQALSISVARGTLAVAGSDGQALASERVTVLRASEWPGRWDRVTSRLTDVQGHLELDLTPGEYALQRGAYDPRQQPATVPLTWTSSGPLSANVRF